MRETAVESGASLSACRGTGEALVDTRAPAIRFWELA
jgi:hypothetical protein